NIQSLASRLQDDDATEIIQVGKKSDVLGSILLALDRPNGRVYAIPKVEDFKEVISPKGNSERRKDFESWKVADFLQELGTPSKSNYNTQGLKAMLEGGMIQQTHLGVSCQPVVIPPSLVAKTQQEHGMLVFNVQPNSIG